jgi:hypothetical protein
MSKVSRRATPTKNDSKVSGEGGEFVPSPARYCTTSATNECSQPLLKTSAVTPENQSNGDNAPFQKAIDLQIASSPTHPQAELTSGRFPQKNPLFLSLGFGGKKSEHFSKFVKIIMPLGS